jgi:hypothetical protein
MSMEWWWCSVSILTLTLRAIISLVAPGVSGAKLGAKGA